MSWFQFAGAQNPVPGKWVIEVGSSRKESCDEISMDPDEVFHCQP